MSTPLNKWAGDHHLELVRVDGLLAGGLGYGPSDIPQLRQYTAYHDVTGSVLAWIRRARDLPDGEAGSRAAHRFPTSSPAATSCSP